MWKRSWPIFRCYSDSLNGLKMKKNVRIVNQSQDSGSMSASPKHETDSVYWTTNYPCQCHETKFTLLLTNSLQSWPVLLSCLSLLMLVLIFFPSVLSLYTKFHCLRVNILEFQVMTNVPVFHSSSKYSSFMFLCYSCLRILW
jgi:hypothetical protein